MRDIVDKGGDIADVARAVKVFGTSGDYLQAAAALRQEFGVSIEEALSVVAWIEGSGDDEFSQLRLVVRTPLV